jgi:hypothetical protein
MQADSDRLEAERVALATRAVRWDATWVEIATAFKVIPRPPVRRRSCCSIAMTCGHDLGNRVCLLRSWFT